MSSVISIDHTSGIPRSSAAHRHWTPAPLTTVTANAWVVSLVASADDNALALNAAQGFTARISSANYNTTTEGDHATAGTVTQPTRSQTVVTSP